MFGTRRLFYKSKEIAKLNPEVIDSQPNAAFLKRLYQQAKQLSQIIAYIWRWADDGDDGKKKEKLSSQLNIKLDSLSIGLEELKSVLCELSINIYINDQDEELIVYKQDIAKLLKTYFHRPTIDSGEIYDHLKKLLAANPRDDQDQSLEAKLLKAVFFEADMDNKDYLFPIFDDFERGVSENFKGLGYLFEIRSGEFHGTLEDPPHGSPELFKFSIPYPPRPVFGAATLDKETLDKWINNRKKGEFFADNPYIPTTCS